MAKSTVFRQLTSLGIMAAALGLAFAPIPGSQQTIVIVSGSELQEPLQALQATFESKNPEINLELKFQGSQDMVNRFIDQQNDFKPTVLIPANGEILMELRERWQAQNGSDPFYEPPRPIVRTILVGIAWADRGKVLFPDNQFNWNRLEQAMQSGKWGSIGGAAEWGSFDFLTTDPGRSNSGQLTLSLWARAKVGGNLTAASLNAPTISPLFSLIKRSVYQPPRSTDTLLQEFITRGANEADVATTYESIALYRWPQAGANQGKPYQIYYLNPTIETVSTGAIVRRDVSDGSAQAARKFLDFLSQAEQQKVFVRYGFRPIDSTIDLQAVANSPWNQNIPGAQVKPSAQTLPPPDRRILTDILRAWERTN